MATAYGCTQKELRDLMVWRGQEAKDKIAADYGNVQEVCKRLKTSPIQGLSDPQDILKRREAFGTNAIQPADNPHIHVEPQKFANVIRNGARVQIDSSELVVGDICVIKCGEQAPADGLVVDSDELKMDESMLTGEMDYVRKGVDVDPVLLAGSVVVEGNGKMVVIAVGVNTQKDIMMQ